ncbi:unnamed protein product [Phyllotreta striolata]|uniref:Mitochondrial assembly of ribosomal large subunit protein 1 n=1 Tax=Phyllotreta striolata TaxID=444603 RepID=A0A9N9TT89_PHYSR|nr:unnamed protein product [Phyllotreta striolata]
MLPTLRHLSRCVKTRTLSLCPCKYPALTLNRRYESKKANSGEDSSNSLGAMSSKYQVYKDEDSEVILDVFEERLKYSDLQEEDEEKKERFEGLNLNRGVTGVFDIEDLVEVLKREKSKNIFVAAVPKEMNYVDYMCVVSGRSSKHMQAIAQFVRKVYKQKRESQDRIPLLEGAESKDWMALDLGNIALHIFSDEARNIYDLESLWSLGTQYDDEYNKPEPISEMLEKHSIYLTGLEPKS